MKKVMKLELIMFHITTVIPMWRCNMKKTIMEHVVIKNPVYIFKPNYHKKTMAISKNLYKLTKVNLSLVQYTYKVKHDYNVCR